MEQFHFITIIDKLIGHNCWHTKIKSNDMRDSAPLFEKIKYDDEYINSDLEEDDTEDYEDSLCITETEESYIVTTSDGKVNPTIEIFIFSKKDIDKSEEK